MVTLDGTLTFFITLELCAGGDLAARLARARGASAHLSNSRRELAAAAAPPAAPIADAVAARWAVALAAGVAAVHAAHVAHRDLKVTRPRQNVPRIILADTLTRPRARARARVARRDTSSPRTCCSARRPTSARRSRSPTLGSRARRSRATSTAASRRA